MKRRIWDEETKRKVIAEKLNGGSLKEIKTKYGIVHDSTIYAWVAEAKKGEKPAKQKPKVHKKSPNRMAAAIVLLNHARQIEGSDPESLRIVYGLAMMALRTFEGH